MFLRMVFTILAISTIAIATNAVGDEYSDGAAIVPIPDGLNTSKFEIKTDAVSVDLEKAILRKENGWFTDDKEVAITARVNISSRKRGGAATTLTVSRVYKFDVNIYEDGRIEIPLRSLPLLDTYNLAGDDYLVTAIVIDLFLSKKKGKSGFTKTLETVIEVSKKIPVPVNPYGEFASVFGDTFSRVVDQAVEEGAETVPFASFGLRFFAGDKAASYTERPGVHAILIGSDSKKAGTVDLKTFDATKLSYETANGLSYNGSKVRNNHLIVSVKASTDPWKALAAASETLERISVEGGSAVKFSRSAGYLSSNLETILDAQRKAKSPTALNFDPEVLEEAVTELNVIRARAFDIR